MYHNNIRKFKHFIHYNVYCFVLFFGHTKLYRLSNCLPACYTNPIYCIHSIWVWTVPRRTERLITSIIQVNEYLFNLHEKRNTILRNTAL